MHEADAFERCWGLFAQILTPLKVVRGTSAERVGRACLRSCTTEQACLGDLPFGTSGCGCVGLSKLREGCRGRPNVPVMPWDGFRRTDPGVLLARMGWAPKAFSFPFPFPFLSFSFLSSRNLGQRVLLGWKLPGFGNTEFL